MRSLLFFKAICIVCILYACNGDKPKVPQIPKGQKTEVAIKRFDKDLFSVNPQEMAASVEVLKSKYPDFLPRFGQMLNIGNPEDTAFVVNLAHFVSDAEVRKVYNETQKEYADLKDIEADLSEGYTYYSYYFKGNKIPEAIAFVSGFNYGIAVGEGFVGVGLDMYMGKDYRYYSLLQFPQFKLPFMSRKYIATDMMKGWLSTEFPNEDKSTELLNAMIHEGKIIYTMIQLFPSMHDSLKTGFTGEQLNWLEKNEKNIWAFIIDNKLLFNKNFSENSRFLNEAPFTPGMPKDSPGRTVAWVGYRIVKSYMDKHPHMTLPELFKLKDSRNVLNTSGYKPMK